jgi:hypothetical protein
VIVVTPPPGYTQTGDPDEPGQTATNPDNRTTTPIVLAPGDVYLNADFGYRPSNPFAACGQIGDTIWFDADADGSGPALVPVIGGSPVNQGNGFQNDSNERGIPGVTVALIRDLNANGRWDVGEPIVATTTTDANGQYLFTCLPITDGVGTDDYLIWVNDTENVLAEMQATYDRDGGTPPTDNSAPIGVPSNTVLGLSSVLNLGTTPIMDQDFGYTARGQQPGLGLIGDTIWFDQNLSGGDQSTQGNEPGIEGVVMQLLDSNGNVIATTTTNENGNYAFGGLPVSAGGTTYRVRVAPQNFAPGGVLQGINETYAAGASLGSNQGNVFTLTSANPINLTQDFSYATIVGFGRIGNLIWRDSNANGIYESALGEFPIGNVTVDLYRDLNCNGVADPGEPRLSTTTTAAALDTGNFGSNGNYLFNLLPVVGTCPGNAAGYVVRVTDVNGVLNGYWHSLGTPGQNNNSQTDPYAVQISSANRDNLTADFGYYLEPACVGNFVWADQNGNGLQDPGEPGIDGVVVQMVITYPNGTTTTLSTVTGDNPAQPGTQSGWYSFCNLLADEDYRVGSPTATPQPGQPAHVISLPLPQPALANREATLIGVGGNALLDSNDPTGTVAEPVQGLTDTSQLSAGSESLNMSYDFGFLQPTAIALANQGIGYPATATALLVVTLAAGLVTWVVLRRRVL